MNKSDYLMQFRRVSKLHEHVMKRICETYELSLLEGTVLCFLYNNPDKDTATNIVELRMLSKGNVSQAVDSLCSRQFLKRTPDATNRRKIHLSLLPTAQPVIDQLDRTINAFRDRMFDGFTAEEIKMYTAFCERIIENTKKVTDEEGDTQ